MTKHAPATPAHTSAWSTGPAAPGPRPRLTIPQWLGWAAAGFGLVAALVVVWVVVQVHWEPVGRVATAACFGVAGLAAWVTGQRRPLALPAVIAGGVVAFTAFWAWVLIEFSRHFTF